MPITYFREARDLDITPETALMVVKPSGSVEAVEMVEGVLLYSVPDGSSAVQSYAITYRQGRIDVVWTIGGIVNALHRDQVSRVWPENFEDGLMDAAISGVTRLRPFGIEGPWTVYVSLAGIKGYQLIENRGRLSDPAWRDQVTLPSLRIDSMDRKSLEPLLQSFWRAFGLRRREGSPQ